MEMLKEAQKLVNVNVTYTHPASGTEQDQFNLKMTNRELEDIMENAWGSYPGGPSQAITDGIIIDLAPYIEQGYAPNFMRIPDMPSRSQPTKGRFMLSLQSEMRRQYPQVIL